MAAATETGAAAAPCPAPPGARRTRDRGRSPRARPRSPRRARWPGCAVGSAGRRSPGPLYRRVREQATLRAVRVLIFHGYLLDGTGSNVYNARLAEALVRLGHEVHLLCQDRHSAERPFVDAAGDWDEGVLRVRALHDEVRCTAYRPDIGGLLPVYVADRYEGIEARTFAECSDEEVERYVQANVAAVRELVKLLEPEIALANHLVMGPAIMSRGLEGKVPYAVKVHGSALEYTVKPQPERFLPYAREGLARAGGILVGSRHTAESLWETLADEAVTARTRLGPPGVDVERFSPRSPAPAAQGLRKLVPTRTPQQRPGRRSEDAFTRDPALPARALGR